MKTMGGSNMVIIITIVIASIVLLIIAAIIAVLLCKRRKPNEKCKLDKMIFSNNLVVTLYRSLLVVIISILIYTVEIKMGNT